MKFLTHLMDVFSDSFPKESTQKWMPHPTDNEWVSVSRLFFLHSKPPKTGESYQPKGMLNEISNHNKIIKCNSESDIQYQTKKARLKNYNFNNNGMIR